MEDLAWSLLGVDLEDTPLPYHKDALRYLPRTLPPREKGHNPKIYGQPWNIERPLNKSLASLPSSPPALKSPPLVAPIGVHVGAKSKSSSDAVASPSVAPSLPVSPASIKDNGSRFNLG